MLLVFECQFRYLILMLMRKLMLDSVAHCWGGVRDMYVILMKLMEPESM